MHLCSWWSQRLQIWCTGWMYKAQPTDKPSLIGAWSFHVIQLKFKGPRHTSGITEARIVKFRTQVGYIWCCQKDDISPPKWAWLWSRDCFKILPRLPWCSASCGFVSDSWATCHYKLLGWLGGKTGCASGLGPCGWHSNRTPGVHALQAYRGEVSTSPPIRSMTFLYLFVHYHLSAFNSDSVYIHFISPIHGSENTHAYMHTHTQAHKYI